jgi:hypothetical protein
VGTCAVPPATWPQAGDTGSNVAAGRKPAPQCWRCIRLWCGRLAGTENVEPEFCTPMGDISPKLAWGRWFKPTGHAYQIPSREGQKPKASGWAFMTKTPPRRSATTVAARHPSLEGIFRQPMFSCNI